MKLKQLFSFSSRSSSSGSLEQGKKDFHAQYMVKEQLGKGGFGVVYSAVRRCDGLEVAVKEVNKDERVVVGNGNLSRTRGWSLATATSPLRWPSCSSCKTCQG